MYIYTYIHIYIHIYKHTHTHIHPHTYTNTFVYILYIYIREDTPSKVGCIVRQIITSNEADGRSNSYFLFQYIVTGHWYVTYFHTVHLWMINWISWPQGWYQMTNITGPIWIQRSVAMLWLIRMRLIFQRNPTLWRRFIFSYPVVKFVTFCGKNAIGICGIKC